MSTLTTNHNAGDIGDKELATWIIWSCSSMAVLLFIISSFFVIRWISIKRRKSRQIMSEEETESSPTKVRFCDTLPETFEIDDETPESPTSS